MARKKNRFIVIVGALVALLLAIGVVVSLSNDTESGGVFDHLFSGETTAEVLGTPTLSVNGDTLTITAGSGDADGFYIYANGSYICSTSISTVRLNEALSEYYGDSFEITARAYSSDGRLSVYSESLTYTRSASTTVTLAAPTISLDGDVLTITEGTGGTGTVEYFAVYENDEFVYQVAASVTTLDLGEIFPNAEAGTYTVQVRAYNQTENAISDFSNSVSYTVEEASDDTSGDSSDTTTDDETAATVVTAPTIALNGDILTIVSGSDNSDYFDIYIGNTVSRTVQASFTELNVSTWFEGYESGVCVIRVIAWNDETRVESDFSNFVVYTIGEVGTAPVISLNGDMLTLVSGFVGAEKVTLYANGERVSAWNDVESQYNLAALLNALGAKSGTYAICMSATVNGVESVTSNSVVYQFTLASTGLSAPTISLDGTTLTITPVSGTATEYRIERSEDGNGYESAVTVAATTSAVTVDISEYAIYDTTFFIVRAYNEITGESADTLNPVSYTKTSAEETYSVTVNLSDGSDFLFLILDEGEEYADYTTNMRDGVIGTSLSLGSSISISPGQTILIKTGNEDCTWSALDSVYYSTSILEYGFVYIYDITDSVSIDLTAEA